MDQFHFCMTVIAGVVAATYVLETVRDSVRRARATNLRPAELKAYEPPTDRTVRQNDDETFHVTLARDEPEYEYKALRLWVAPVALACGRTGNGDEWEKAKEEGWEPFLAGGSAAGKWGGTELYATHYMLRRPKKQEAA